MKSTIETDSVPIKHVCDSASLLPQVMGKGLKHVCDSASLLPQVMGKGPA